MEQQQRVGSPFHVVGSNRSRTIVVLHVTRLPVVPKYSSNSLILLYTRKLVETVYTGVG